MTKQVLTYTRVSTQEQATEGTSLEYQSNQLDQYCKMQGWQIIRKYEDAGFSGKDGNRPDLKRLLSEVKSGQSVVVLKEDRLARNLRLLLDIEAQLKERGVSIVFIKESIDTSTTTGRIVFQQLGLVAEWERDTITERTKTGRIQRQSKGCWAAGASLYGYDYDKTSKKLVINQMEAAVVRRIFSLYIYDRLGVMSIARLLNKEGVKTVRNANMWHPTGILNIIRHGGYQGQHPLKIECPAIIEPELWELARQRRQENKPLHRRKSSPWLLQGLAECGVCGHNLRCERNASHRRAYCCRGNLQLERPDNNTKCLLNATSGALLGAWSERWRALPAWTQPDLHVLGYSLACSCLTGAEMIWRFMGLDLGGSEARAAAFASNG